MEYYSAIKRNDIESVEVMWMNLEPVIQSKVRKKQILYVKCIYMESRKMVLMNLIADRNRGADVANRLLEMGNAKVGMN